MRITNLLSWKAPFYGLLLPALAKAGPAWGCRFLSSLGKATGHWPPRRRWLIQAATRGKEALQADWDPKTVASLLAVGTVRGLSRDYLLDRTDWELIAPAFHVQGFPTAAEHLHSGKAIIFLGSHLGAHVAGIHWLTRQNIPLRFLFQRPKHVSTWLDRWFTSTCGPPHPQSSFFLTRSLTPVEATRRILLARDALRAGQAVYINGDIPWPAPKSRVGLLMGRRRPILSIWADLAALSGVPVVPVFCLHQDNGQYQLTFQEPIWVKPGHEYQAMCHYLEQLQNVLHANPAAAVPYLTWPSYTREDPAKSAESPESSRPAPHLRQTNNMRLP